VTCAIGLDIGSSAVRAAQVTSGRRGPAVLERVGQVILPLGAARDGEIVDVDAVVAAVRLLWSRYGFKGRRVAVGVANQQVVVRQVDLPWLPAAELRQSLQFQAQDYLPIPLEHALLDYHLIDDHVGDNGERLARLMLVAAQRAMVDSILEVLRRAKLEPAIVNLDAFAVLRSLATPGVPGEPGGELLVDVGAAVTNVVVHEAGSPKFVRILLLGAGTDADAAAATGQLPPPPPAVLGAQSAVAVQQVVSAPDQVARIVEEVRGSLDYYRAQPDAVAIARVVIAGGGSRLPGLPDRLGEAVRLPVVAGHPMQELKLGKLGLAPDELLAAEPHLAVAVGLALGAVER
jgi:type IV pilus assembly protein PilM